VSQYILDTDHVSLILCNHPQVTAKASLHQIAVTIITVQELFNGWIGRINDPSLVHNLPALYTKLWTTVKYLQTVNSIKKCSFWIIYKLAMPRLRARIAVLVRSLTFSLLSKLLT
jgi:hypothetical protein